MESSMVKFIISYLNKNIKEYILIKSNSYGSFWDIEFEYKEIKVKISGDIGFSISLFIEDNVYDLSQYDRTVINHMETSKENLLIQLDILKDFLSNI